MFITIVELLQIVLLYFRCIHTHGTKVLSNKKGLLTFSRYSTINIDEKANCIHFGSLQLLNKPEWKMTPFVYGFLNM